jgi:hypothetical protein
VDGVLELCHVLIRDQTDSSGARAASVGGAGLNGQPTGGGVNASIRKQGPHFVEREEMAEEQGWVARMVHLFRAESLDVQFEVCFFRKIVHVIVADIMFESFYKLQENISTLAVNGCDLLSRLSSPRQSSFVGGIKIATIL